MKGQGHASGPAEEKIGGDVAAVPGQLMAEDPHEADPELGELEITVDHEVPGEGLAEARHPHAQIRGLVRQ